MAAGNALLTNSQVSASAEYSGSLGVVLILSRPSSHLERDERGVSGLE
jgi:hypothetical protein